MTETVGLVFFWLPLALVFLVLWWAAAVAWLWVPLWAWWAGALGPGTALVFSMCIESLWTGMVNE